MTRLIARLILAMLILPTTGTLFVFLFILLIMPSSPPTSARVVSLYGLVYVFVAAYWILLWRGVVRWTPARVGRTLLAGVGALLVSGIMAPLPARFMGGQMAAGFFVAGAVAPIMWVLATVLIWRETPAERIERLSLAGRETVCCPLCGYNMTGLREARCPECGVQFTLDQLMAAQPQRDRVMLPQE